MSLLQELSQRNLYQAVGGYLATSWFLLKSGEVAFPALGLPLWSFRAMVLFLVAAFPVLLVVAWRYRITPEGLAEHELRKPEAQSPEAQSSRRLSNWVLIALLGVALAATLISTRIEQSGAGAPRSIAVLPFVNMSGDVEQEYFADGLTEELLNVLAKNPELKVAGRTSSFAYKGRNEDLREIGKQLNVRVVLEGSVRKSGDSLRVTAQLIDVASGYHLFSETYDRQLDDVFRIQDDIARRVVQEVSYELLQRDSGTFVAAGPDPAAYERYLLARRAVNQRRLDELPGAIAALEEILTREPEFARGWSALADAYAVASQYGVVTRESAQGPLEVAARRALALDPQLSEAHVSIGILGVLRGDETEQVLEHFRQAVHLNPNNPDALMWLGRSLRGHAAEEAAAVLKRAFALDPLHPVASYHYAMALFETGQVDKAWEIVRAMATTGSASSPRLKAISQLSHLTGDLAGAALALLEELEENKGDVYSLGNLVYFSALLGFTDEVEALIAVGLFAYPEFIYFQIERIRLLLDPAAGGPKPAAEAISALSSNSDPTKHYFLGSIYASRGQCSDAYREFLSAFGSGSNAPWDIEAILQTDLYGGANVIFALRCTDPDRAQALFQDYSRWWLGVREQGYGGWLPAFRLASGHAALGESELALEWLEEAVDAGLPPLRRLRIDVWLSDLADADAGDLPGNIEATLAARLAEQRGRLEAESFSARLRAVALELADAVAP